MEYEATRTPNETDDDWITNQLFPLKTWEWFDGQEQTY